MRDVGFSNHTPARLAVEEACAGELPTNIDCGSYYYQKLIRLRKTTPAMVYEMYESILAEHAQVYAFTRTLEDYGRAQRRRWRNKTIRPYRGFGWITITNPSNPLSARCALQLIHQNGYNFHR